MNILVVLDSKGEEIFDGSDFDYKTECFNVVNAFQLGITSDDQSEFILFNGPITSLFDFIHPLAKNSLLARW